MNKENTLKNDKEQNCSPIKKMKETLHDISNTIKIQNAISENEDCFIDGIVNAESAETIQRYGAAVKEHVVAYTGIDNETGKHLKTAPYKYPRIIEYVDELPKTLGGKIKRAQIRKEDQAASEK